MSSQYQVDVTFTESGTRTYTIKADCTEEYQQKLDHICKSIQDEFPNAEITENLWSVVDNELETLIKDKKVYLALPYSKHADRSFKVANRVAASLMKKGAIVFSPISHSHPLAHAASLPASWGDFWAKQDLPLVEWADIILVINDLPTSPLDSEGVQAEINHAKSFGKPVHYITSIATLWRG